MLSVGRFFIYIIIGVIGEDGRIKVYRRFHLVIQTSRSNEKSAVLILRFLLSV